MSWIVLTKSMTSEYNKIASTIQYINPVNE